MNERQSRRTHASSLQRCAIGDPLSCDPSSRGTQVAPKKGTHQVTHKGTHQATHEGTHQATHQQEPKKHRRKSKKIRRIPYIFGNDRLDEKLFNLLDEHDPQVRMYVYRMEDTRKIAPAILICAPFPDLLEHLRDEYYGGEFALIIRRGKIIELSGIVSIASPLRLR